MLSASRPLLANTKGDSQSFLGDQLNFCFPTDNNSPISNSTPPLQPDTESDTELEITLYSSSPHSNSNSNPHSHSHLPLHSQQDQEKVKFSAPNHSISYSNNHIFLNSRDSALFNSFHQSQSHTTEPESPLLPGFNSKSTFPISSVSSPTRSSSKTSTLDTISKMVRFVPRKKKSSTKNRKKSKSLKSKRSASYVVYDEPYDSDETDEYELSSSLQ
ncbi:unnamed protein product [Ambrosiozyma monospora]|uniref:Unnamed protein product n=1 Tax=Ambrosiozyma monospora TaxID=43982 RepID=A0ACB5U5Y5_AMBMO|nr:unnamed protein product [Ambrosiozyma monospora]